MKRYTVTRWLPRTTYWSSAARRWRIVCTRAPMKFTGIDWNSGLRTGTPTNGSKRGRSSGSVVSGGSGWACWVTRSSSRSSTLSARAASTST
ncbi:hypothetical protein BE08_39270, partial [Sorangium cellulosum]